MCLCYVVEYGIVIELVVVIVDDDIVLVCYFVV